MAHNLNETNGKVSFFANVEKEMPWHGLGQKVIGAKSWNDAIKLSGLDWEVSKLNLVHPITGNKLPEVFGIFRNDTFDHIGTVGNVYKPIQNSEAFQFVDSLLEVENGCHFETAGALGKGEKIFCTAKVPFSISPDKAPDDKSFCYLLFTNSHDGKSKAIAKLTTVRVVCNNTLNLALNSEGLGELSVKHSGQGLKQLDSAKKMLQNVKQDVNSLKKKFDILANRQLSPESFDNCMKRIWGEDWNTSTRKKNVSVQIASLFDNNDNNTFPEIKGSAYNLLQAVTNYVDHYKTVKVTEGRATQTEELIRTESAIFGAGDELKVSALDKILEATANCPEMPKKTSVLVSSKLDSILSQVEL